MPEALDELLARLVAVEAALLPQRLAETVARAWDPKGQEPRIIDADGNTLDYEPALQLMGGTSTIDPVTQRVVYTPTASGGGAGQSRSVGDSFLSGGGPQPVPGLECTVTVADNGDGFGHILYLYAVSWQAWGNAAVKAVNTSWEFQSNGAQVLNPMTGSPAAARPNMADIAITTERYVHTAPAGYPTLSTGAATTIAGGLAVTAGGGTASFGAVPVVPIFMRLPAGVNAVDVYWTNAAAGANEVAINMGIAAAIPLGV